MASVRITFGKDFDITNSFDVAVFWSPPYSPNNTYLSRLFLDFIQFTSPSAGGPAAYATTNAGFYQDFSDNVAGVDLSGVDFGDVLRGGAGNDVLNGGGGNDVLEGGPGTNTIDGGTGTNTVSYKNFVSQGFFGVYVDLSNGIGRDRLDTGILSDSLQNIQNVVGSGSSDALNGSEGKNLIEGGAGSDTLDGGGGIDTLSYANSASGVAVSLESGFGSGGDAQGDAFNHFENVLGSAFSDVLEGDAGDNTLNGNGGSDRISGLGGDDRLVIDGTPVLVDGGADKDYLFVQGGGSVSLSEGSFVGIEAVYVRNDTSLDMSAVTTGARIASQSTSSHHAEIIGTSGADRIVAGKGGDTIEGGAGGDKIFAGGGADTFRFQAGFGRDNLYGLDLALDHIAIDIAGVESGSMTLTELKGGQDTIVTFAGVEDTNAIILRGVSLAEAQTALDNGLFTFGA